MIIKALASSCPEVVLVVIEVLRKEAKHVCRLFAAAKTALPHRGSLDAHVSSHSKRKDGAVPGTVRGLERSVVRAK